MTRVPASANFTAFTLGSPTNETGRFADEGPQTDVTLTSPFWISQHEVTQREYQSVMSNNPSFFTGDPDRPVEMVTYAEATNYCAKLTLQDRQTGLIPADFAYRLPTEAEWECAARAGSSTRFSFGDVEAQLNNYAWQANNSNNTTHPVETRQPNAWGLYDMYGNVYEWCQDWYGTYAGGAISNPQGPATGQYRVIRGGAYNNTSARLCRSALRGNLNPDSRSLFVGFRVILAPISSAQAPVITSALMATGQVGVAFSYQIIASNNPTNYAASGLPAGLSMNSTTGLISGTPTAAGYFTVILTAANASGTGTATLTLTIVPPAPVISSTATASGTVGSSFTYQITASNNPTNYSATGLPVGLNLNPATGQITGAPAEAGTFTITLSAKNAGGTGTKTITLTITGAAAARIDTGPLMNTARMGHSIAALPDGRVAVFGGHGQSFVALNSMEIWNPTSNAFASVTMPSSFDGGALVRLADGRYLLAGGAANLGGAPGYKTAQIFDPAAGTVTATASTMVRARCNNSGALLGNGKALIVGGWYSSDSGGYGEIYDSATGAFTATGPLNTARSSPVVLPASDGQAVIAGGSGVFGSPPALERVELYDPTNNTFSVQSESIFAGETGWRLYTGFGREIGEQRMADGRYALIAYRTVNNVTETVLALFDPGTKQFAKVAMTPAFTEQVSVFVPVVSRGENAGYFLAGSNTGGGANFTFRVYRVNLAAGERVAVSEPLSVTAYYLGGNAMCWLGDGRILVTGGTTSVSSTYNFNPVRNTFFVSGLAAVRPAPVISSAVTASGAVGRAFTYQITATNDPASFTAAGLPPGLVLDANTGLISGTPTEAGTFTVTLSAANSSGAGTATLIMVITPPVKVIFDNGNVFAVSSQPSNPTTFNVAEPVVITYIQDYHYFNGGALPGTISLRHSDGAVYGPWQTVGLAGQGGVANANWIAEPMVIIKPGTYTVIDSDPSTWSQNSSSGSAGFSLIMGYSLPAVPALSIRLEPDSQVVISWPASATGFSLEAAESLLSSNWQALAQRPGTVGDQYAVTNSAAGEMRFFRLQKR